MTKHLTEEEKKTFIKNAILSGNKEYIQRVLNKYWNSKKKSVVENAQEIFGVTT